STVLRLANGHLAVIGGTQNDISQPYIEFLPPSPDCPFGAECLIPIHLLKESGIDGVKFPFAHVLPSGRIFLLAGAHSKILDPLQRFTPAEDIPQLPPLGLSIHNPKGPSRTYPMGGASVLLPLSSRNGWRAEILVCGGGSGSWMQKVPGAPNMIAPALTSCGRIAPEDPDAEWEYEEMPIARTMGTFVILPDRKVLFLNGAQKGIAGYNAAIKPAHDAVLYDMDAPLGMRWRVLKGSDIARMYHSTALLTPTAEILLAGSSPAKSPLYPSLYPSENRLELYTPAYLQTGCPRPSILPSTISHGTSASSPIPYSSTITLTATLPNRPPFGASQPSRKRLEVVLIEPGYAGHGVVSGQRGVELDL
ncbi:hypothetical protein HK097_006203, partial [Rhizophlyctis rosea]